MKWTALIAVGLSMVARPAFGPVGAGGPETVSPAEAEQAVVERKVRLAQAYGYRGERERALELLRQVQVLQPGNEEAAALVVELWLETWDEQIVAHVESDPAAIKLKPLDEFVEVKTVGAALIAGLADRGDARPYREVAVIAPYVRREHADALAKLAKEGDKATMTTAAALLCVLGDARGDKRARELLMPALRRGREWGDAVLLPYATPETLERLLDERGLPTVQTALLNLVYVEGRDALLYVRDFATATEPNALRAAIRALIELGEREEAAKAVATYRRLFSDTMASGALGHYLLVFYAGLRDRERFFEVFDSGEKELRTPLARMLAAQMCVAAGRRADAEALIKPVLDEIAAGVEAEPEDADLYYQLANAIAVAGTDPARAKGALLDALRHHPRTSLRPQIYELLARLYLREGKLDQAGVLADAVVRLYSMEHPRHIALQRQVATAGKATADEQ